jgi:hypothetical protein
MLTRHEILRELRRIGIKEFSVLKVYVRNFEDYMEINNGSEFDEENGTFSGDNGFKHPFSNRIRR